MSGWRARAACAGRPVDDWFAATGPERAAAVATCESCPVRLPCLDAALRAEATRPAHERHVYGLFGGLSPEQRLPLLRTRTDRGAA